MNNGFYILTFNNGKQIEYVKDGTAMPGGFSAEAEIAQGVTYEPVVVLPLKEFETIKRIWIKEVLKISDDAEETDVFLDNLFKQNGVHFE